MGFFTILFSRALLFLTDIPAKPEDCWQIFLDEPECPRSIIEK